MGTEPPLYAPAGVTTAARSRDEVRALFGRVMFLVAVAMGFTAAGAWIGRDLTGGWVIGAWIAALALVLGMGFVKERSGPVAMALLFAIALLLGLAIGPTIADYMSVEGGGTIVAQSAGATALFIAAFGTAGYATRRDLQPLVRGLFWATLLLILAGLVLIFVNIPNGVLIWSILGLVIFAGWTMIDFQRLRRGGVDDAVPIALGIFLDVFNVFLFFLNIFGGNR
ncbi:MAG: Bax inhibitor-1 family protein [Thermoleophilia bacterium]|jgi:modulator of FtsH protease|nr:Bax inhibitor-1 family protein [Thermoleophilia bacterium]